MNIKKLVFGSIYRGKTGAGIVITYALLIIFGFLLGYFYTKKLNILLIIPAIIGMLTALGAADIFDDYFDFINGIDKEGNTNTFYRVHPILGLKMSGKQTFMLGILLTIISILIAIIISLFGRVLIFAFVIIGFVVLFEYAGPPLKYRYHYSGEIGPFLSTIIVLEGSYYIDTKMINLDIIIISISIGIIIGLLDFIGNCRDIETDKKVKIKTLSIFLGINRDIKFYIALFSFSYLFLLLLIIFQFIPIYSLILFFTVPLFILNARNFIANGIPEDAEKYPGLISMFIIILLILSMVIYYI